MRQFGKVAVLLGGDFAERGISLKSGAAVLEGLRRQGVDAHPFDPAARPLAALLDEGFDRAFVMLHGRGGEGGDQEHGQQQAVSQQSGEEQGRENGVRRRPAGCIACGRSRG
ncbi:MAG TPA: hypothetical protein EYP40_02470 [Chromatiales bacterium]|nr:hypothetical protein [Chromatiales bacterium]